jgi:hypothetical protein
MRTDFVWETMDCPLCGAPMVRRCARCNNDIFAPITDRCRFCGLPPPWAAERQADSDHFSIQRWRDEEGVNAPAIPLYKNPRQRGSG